MVLDVCDVLPGLILKSILSIYKWQR